MGVDVRIYRHDLPSADSPPDHHENYHDEGHHDEDYHDEGHHDENYQLL